MIKVSTGLRNAVLDTAPLRTALTLGFIKLYSGTAPGTADAAIDPSNTLLVTLSNGSTGTGVTFAASAVNGTLAKNASEIWSGVNGNGGVATFYRHVLAADTGLASTTDPRVQGLISTAGSDMNMTNTVLAGGATQTMDFYQLALPTL